MNWFLAAAIFITSWAVLLFLLLPIGIEREENPGPGHALGAPRRMHWKPKLLANTLLSLLVTALLLWLLERPAMAEGSSPLLRPPAAQTPPDEGALRVAPCRNRVPHQPAADVAYSPGMDAQGRPVAPADLGLSAPATEDLANPEISLYAPLSGTPPLPPNANRATQGQGAETFAQFGTVQVQGGQALLNGVPLSQPDACPQ